MRRTIAAVFLLLAVALTQSCSSSVEDVSSGAQPLIGSCGAKQATVSFGYTGGTGSNPLTGSTRLFIPSEVTLAANDRFYPVPSGHVDGTLNFDGGVACYYSVPLPSSGATTPAFPMTFTHCSNGMLAGDEITTSSVTLSGSYTPNTEDETFTATATLGVDLDDGDPCTVDVCLATGPDHSGHVADNTVISSDCTGTWYCQSGALTEGPAPSAPSDSCNTYSCNTTTGQWVDTSTCTSPPSLAGYAPDKTLPTDFSAEMTALYSSQSGIVTADMDPKRLAVIHGHVRSRDNGTLSSVVTVGILNHPEFGTTVTRLADGGFDMVVNGGPTCVLRPQRLPHRTAASEDAVARLDCPPRRRAGRA